MLCAYAVLAVISNCYPPVWGRLPTRYSPVRHSVNLISARRLQQDCFVRLACVKHAASVHPEPGSNSHVLIWFWTRTTTSCYHSRSLLWFLFLKFSQSRRSSICSILSLCQCAKGHICLSLHTSASEQALCRLFSFQPACHARCQSFLEFSGLFYYLIINVLFCFSFLLSQASLIDYHTCQFLSSTFFYFFEFLFSETL